MLTEIWDEETQTWIVVPFVLERATPSEVEQCKEKLKEND